MRASDSSAPSPSAQLQALCRAYPQAPKKVIVPRSQIGRALEDALARMEGGWAGVNTQIVRHLAEDVAQPRIVSSGRTALPASARSFLAAQLLDDLQQQGGLEGLPGPHQLADTVAEAIETLRRGGASLADVQDRSETAGASATLRVVAACYERYLEILDAEALYDDAQVFDWATEAVRRSTSPEVEQSVVAVCDGVDLPERAAIFLHAVRAVSRDFFRIGRSVGGEPPPQTAAARFADVSTPGRKEDGDESLSIRTCRAVGVGNEVDAVFRDVLDDEVPLDEVEIAVTGERPYVSLIADRAAQLDLPVSIGTGVPAQQTRTGTALLAFFGWITEEFAPDRLIRMLRSGHLRIDRVRADIEDDIGPVDLQAHDVATLLAGRQYEAGREGYGKALRGAINRTGERIRELKEKNLEPDHERSQKRALEFAHRIVQRLLDLVPRRTTVGTMAAKARRFVEDFGPVDPPPAEKPEAERSLDEAARSVLYTRIDALTDLPVSLTASGPRLAALLRRWLEGQYVRAQHPRPGTAHVVPLESAGYGGRKHLYVVGMDSDTLSTAAVEDALLRDADRRALSESMEGVLPESRSAPDDAQWRHEQALARQSGSLSLYTRVYDMDSGEERFPAPLFLQLEESRDAASGRLHGFLPHPDRLCLSDGEEWLRAYRAAGSSVSTQETAREALARQYPWIPRGEEARAARRSDEYTRHDGLLPDGQYPVLDFLDPDYDGPPMSAGRLETLAETPYLYFLEYVLGVDPLDEPALDDEPWLNGRRRGSILHATFEAFMKELKQEGERPAPKHELRLRGVLKNKLEEETEKVAPPSEVVREAALRRLWDDALVFLRSEVEYCRTHEPLHHEVGFGYGRYRERQPDLGNVSLTVDGTSMPLRGRIDRVDVAADETLVVWDYKTGSVSSFEDGDPINEGRQLQWALYAYALEELEGETVGRSGYYFPTTKEMGARLAFDPASHRATVERCLKQLSDLAGSGSFPMHPKARYRNAWKYRGYERLFRDLEARSRTLKQKTYPDTRPHPPSFDE